MEVDVRAWDRRAVTALALVCWTGILTLVRFIIAVTERLSVPALTERTAGAVDHWLADALTVVAALSFVVTMVTANWTVKATGRRFGILLDRTTPPPRRPRSFEISVLAIGIFAWLVVDTWFSPRTPERWAIAGEVMRGGVIVLTACVIVAAMLVRLRLFIRTRYATEAG